MSKNANISRTFHRTHERAFSVYDERVISSRNLISIISILCFFFASCLFLHSLPPSWKMSIVCCSVWFNLFFSSSHLTVSLWCWSAAAYTDMCREAKKSYEKQRQRKFKARVQVNAMSSHYKLNFNWFKNYSRKFIGETKYKRDLLQITKILVLDELSVKL